MASSEQNAGGTGNLRGFPAQPSPMPAAGNELPTRAPAGAPGKRHRGSWVMPVLLVAVVASGWVVLQRQVKAKAALATGRPVMPPAQITMVAARKGDIGVYVSGLIGTVTPIYTVAVKSRVDGELMKVSYQEGQLVQTGDPLAEIDSRPFLAMLTQAEGQLAKDQALLENARIDLSRYREAYAKDAIPKQQLDTQLAIVHQYEGAVKNDEGQVQTAKVNVAYCSIAAPISGRVGLRLVDPGNIVHGNDTTPLVIITQLRPITVVFAVAQDYLPQIQRQWRGNRPLAVEVFDRDRQVKLATGTVLTLDNQIDTVTATVKIKAMFQNEDDALYPNQFVNVKLLVDTEREVILVPTQTIQRNAQGPFVYLVRPDQTVSMHPITQGTTDGTLTAVQGLTVGALIAADNFNRLQDGAKVVERKPIQASGPGGSPRRKGGT